MTQYEPKVGDWVKVVKCHAKCHDHIGLVGQVVNITDVGQRHGYDVIGADHRSCWASEVAPFLPDASAVYAQARCDCAEFRRLLLEEITKDVTADPSLALEVLALVHARRKNGKGERDAAQ